MNRFVGIGVAALVLAVVVVIGLQLIRPNDAGGPSASPTRTPEPTTTPSPSEAAVDFPPAGGLAIGTRHSVVLAGGVRLSISVPTTMWASNGSFLLESRRGSPEEMQMFFWTGTSPQGIYADPCAHEPSPPAGPSAADLAAAIAMVPGTYLVSGPADVTVDGRAGKLVELIVPEDAGCIARTFYLWYDNSVDCPDGCARYASWLGSTIRIWIIDVDGVRVVIEGETRVSEASSELEREMDQIVDSIQFE
jgi:hypothetical protein